MRDRFQEHLTTAEFTGNLYNGHRSNAYDYANIKSTENGDELAHNILNMLLKAEKNNRDPVVIRLCAKDKYHLKRSYAAGHAWSDGAIYDVKIVDNFSDDERSIIVFSKPEAFRAVGNSPPRMTTNHSVKDITKEVT